MRIRPHGSGGIVLCLSAAFLCLAFTAEVNAESSSTCGNGIIEEGEGCDDGINNANLPNKCRTDCTVPICGDGIVDGMEACDDGNFVDSDDCALCGGSECGDGVRSRAEECDDGFFNSDTAPNACRTDCTSPVCGDGVVDTEFGEWCDDGNTNVTDSCHQCTPTECNDGIVQMGEQCDEGEDNSNTRPDACRRNCKRAACHDGVIDTNEECDDGNNLDCDGCSSLCFEETCGDNIVQACLGEECDDGVDNANFPNKCRTDCKDPSCGDGIVDSISNGEDCDDGNFVDTDDCARCGIPECGDGIRHPAEECDDGALNSNTAPNACRTNCTYPGCGDGIVDSEFSEECDDGNVNPFDHCHGCLRTECGDGIVQFAAGEECDDGSLNSNVLPNACRRNCKRSECHDHVVDTGEECDDGNISDCDGCSAACFVELCGDNIVQACLGEQCDDGVDNANVPNRCRPNCTNPSCGDGIVDAISNGEACDDHNSSDSDACTNDCRAAACGDGLVRAGFEECDDGGTADGDGCSSLCETQQPCGDATDDGEITASDAERVLKRGVGIDVECPAWICNVDGDDDVDAGDALRVLRRSVGSGTTACGPPTGIVVRLTTPALLGALQLKIDYANVHGEVGGFGALADCAAAQPGVQSAFVDSPERVLGMDLTSQSGIVGPAPVARCSFEPFANVEPEDFTVDVEVAVDLLGNDVAAPGIRVVPD